MLATRNHVFAVNFSQKVDFDHSFFIVAALQHIGCRHEKMPILQLVNSESSANIGKESDISGRIYSIQGSHSGADKSQVRIIVTCLAFHLCLDCTVINTYIFCGYFKSSRSPIIQSDYNLCGIIVVKTINRDDMLCCLLKSPRHIVLCGFPFHSNSSAAGFLCGKNGNCT